MNSDQPSTASACLAIAAELWPQLYALNASLVDTRDHPQALAMLRRLRSLYRHGAELFNEKESKVNSVLTSEERASVHCGACYAMMLNYAMGGPRDFAAIQRFLDRGAVWNDTLALSLRSENWWFGECGYKQDFLQCELDCSLAEALLAVPGNVSPSQCQYTAGTVLTWILKRQLENDANSSDPSKKLSAFQRQQVQARIDAILARTLPPLQRDADMGDAIAVDWLAWRYYNGETVAQDKARGASLFERSGRMGLGWAQLWTALRYRDGDGVPMDLHKAFEWAQMAAQQGIEDAVKELESLKAKLPKAN